MVSRSLLLAALVACGGAGAGPAHLASGATRTDVSFVTLYRDAAVVRQRVEVTVPASGSLVLPVAVPVGLDGTKLYVADTGPFQGIDVRTLAEPGTLEVTVTGSGSGAFYLGYQTDRLTWKAEYTLTTTGARDRSVLRGALAVRNTTGIELKRARIRVVDSPLAAAANRKAELLREEYAGIKPGTSPVAQPREIGVANLAAGETRIDLLGAGAPRPMVSTLVYDPIGSDLDHAGDQPDDDPLMGVLEEPRPRVSESLELSRDPVMVGLPGGAVRLFERRKDGSLVVLGEARMFDTATRAATTDTVAVGTAAGVTGKREQRDFADDDDRHRLTEEIRVTLTNERDYPVEVVVREHLYRMETWNIAFASHATKKEGPQQIAMRVTVPAHGTASATYVVVYPWKQK